RDGMAPFPCRGVHYQNEYARPLDVPQESVAQAGAAVGTLNETRYVRHDEAFTRAEGNDPQVRHERGKMVVGDLRFGRRHYGNERRLAHVRKTYQADVGQELQFEPQPALLARLSLLGEG